jgi:hypothetical protein
MAGISAPPRGNQSDRGSSQHQHHNTE